LTLNEKIQAAAGVRPFVIGPQVVEVAMKTGAATSLAADRVIC
jgi:hypothetical protein